MNKINSKNAERHILLATTDLKERGVVVPATVAKEAVEMAEQELKDKAVEMYKKSCPRLKFGKCDNTPYSCDGICKYIEDFTQKLK